MPHQHIPVFMVVKFMPWSPFPAKPIAAVKLFQLAYL